MPLIDAHGVRLYCRWEGREDAPRLLLLHPVGADHSLWYEVVPLLTHRFQVLRPDLRGHGGSDAPSGDYRLDELASDVLSLCDRVGWDRFAVCGVSLGGMTAARIASLAPSRVTALAVCSASPRMGQPPGGWDTFAQLALSQGMGPIADGMRDRMFGEAFRAAAPAIVQRAHRVTTWMAPQGYAGAVAVLRDADLTPLLPSLHLPALVMRGRQDALVPIAAAEAWTNGLPQATLHSFECGHFPPLEDPAAFADVLQQFVAPALGA